MARYRLLVLGLAFLGVGIAGLVLLRGGPLAAGHWSGTPVADGKPIFRSGRDPDGQLITSTGGMMMGVSCAACHGADGRGRRTPMFVSPDITYRNLTDPAGMLELDGARGPTYTDALLRRAITQGVDADGAPLAWPMPRWRLTDREWAALLAYLQTLR